MERSRSPCNEAGENPLKYCSRGTNQRNPKFQQYKDHQWTTSIKKKKRERQIEKKKWMKNINRLTDRVAFQREISLLSGGFEILLLLYYLTQVEEVNQRGETDDGTMNQTRRDVDGVEASRRNESNCSRLKQWRWMRFSKILHSFVSISEDYSEVKQQFKRRKVGGGVRPGLYRFLKTSSGWWRCWWSSGRFSTWLTKRMSKTRWQRTNGKWRGQSSGKMWSV